MHEPNRQIKPTLIRDERDARPFFDNAQDFRARDAKIHKRYRLAIGIADVGVPYGETAHRQSRRPMHKMVCKVLIERVEFRSYVFFWAPRGGVIF